MPWAALSAQDCGAAFRAVSWIAEHAMAVQAHRFGGPSFIRTQKGTAPVLERKDASKAD